jgi:hypothetical protein
MDKFVITGGAGGEQGTSPKWSSMDSVLTSPELHDLCLQLGFAPPIWHKTEQFIERIESSIDQSTPEREQSRLRGNGDRGDEVVLLTDPDAFRLVLDEAENSFQRWTESAQNTREFDEVIQLLRNIRELLVEHKPLQTSIISDLTLKMWCGKNWERLSEPLYERKLALDGVLRDVGLAREQSKGSGFDCRSYSLAKAAQAYVANDWMHTRWLTTLLGSDMLSNLRSSVSERGKLGARWCFALIVAGGVLGYFPNTRTLGIVLCMAGIGGYEFWIVYTQAELDRIIGEVHSGFYSGRVLAERLERLDRFRCEVPSILTELLRVQPGARGCD